MTSRDPKGVPTGGRFAAQQHAEADISLSEPARAPFTRDDAEVVAFETDNVSARSTLDDCPGEIIEDPSGLEPGDIVWTRGHGKYRKAVVHSVGKKNAVAVFTTPGAVADGIRVREFYATRYHDRVRMAEQWGDMAGRNHDFLVRQTDPDDPTYNYSFYTPEKVAEEVASAKARLAEAGSREEAVRNGEEAMTAEIVDAYEKMQAGSLADDVLFTNSTVKPGQAKLDPSPAR